MDIYGIKKGNTKVKNRPGTSNSFQNLNQRQSFDTTVCASTRKKQ